MRSQEKEEGGEKLFIWGCRKRVANNPSPYWDLSDSQYVVLQLQPRPDRIRKQEEKMSEKQEAREEDCIIILLFLFDLSLIVLDTNKGR